MEGEGGDNSVPLGLYSPPLAANPGSGSGTGAGIQKTGLDSPVSSTGQAVSSTE